MSAMSVLAAPVSTRAFTLSPAMTSWMLLRLDSGTKHFIPTRAGLGPLPLPCLTQNLIRSTCVLAVTSCVTYHWGWSRPHCWQLYCLAAVSVQPEACWPWSWPLLWLAEYWVAPSCYQYCRWAELRLVLWDFEVRYTQLFITDTRTWRHRRRLVLAKIGPSSHLSNVTWEMSQTPRTWNFWGARSVFDAGTGFLYRFSRNPTQRTAVFTQNCSNLVHSL